MYNTRALAILNHEFRHEWSGLAFAFMLFLGISNKYIDWTHTGKRNPVTPETVEGYYKIQKRICKEIGNFSVSRLNKKTIQKLKEAFISRQCKNSYIEKHLIFLRNFLKWAKIEQKLKVMDYRKIEIPKRERKFVEYLDKDEVNLFLKSIYKNGVAGYRFYALVVLMLDTGMRIGEALNLKREQINWKKRKAVIIGKGGKKAPIFFHPWSLNTLKTYLDMRSDDFPYVFISHYGGLSQVQWTYSCAQRYFSIYSKISGIHVNSHKIRKTAANTMKKNGADIRDVQLFLRHSKIATTEYYYLGIDYEEVRKKHNKYVDYRY